MSLVVLSVWLLFPAVVALVCLLWAVEPTRMFPGGTMWFWCDGVGIPDNFLRSGQGLGRVRGIFFQGRGGKFFF